jgi:polyhydroxyalkanoate synthesis regulator phasin
VTVSSESSTTSDVKVDASSPEYIVTACELATFKEIVPIKTVSWRQKKKLLKFLQDSEEEFQAVESKLVSGGQLSPKEQIVYDSNPGNFGEKISYLQSEIKQMVDEGKLTASEKQELLSSLSTNIRSIEVEAEAATGARKKQLEDKKPAVMARKVAVEAISPIQHRLRNGSEIQKLRVRLFPLLALEDKGRSMSLTLADLKTLEEKVDIEANITLLETSSRGWFEEEADFKAMCDYEAAEAKAKAMRKYSQAPAKGSSAAKASTGKSSSASTGGWSSIGVTKKSSSAPSATKKTSSSSFAAAFDDDSD